MTTVATITAAAAALVDTLTAALAAADLDDVLATTDPVAHRTAALGAGSVLVGPPVLTWGGVAGGGADAEWTLTLTTAGDYQGAWDRLDGILCALADSPALTLARATPATLTDPTGGEPLPAYVLTLDTTTT